MGTASFSLGRNPEDQSASKKEAAAHSVPFEYQGAFHPTILNHGCWMVQQPLHTKSRLSVETQSCSGHLCGWLDKMLCTDGSSIPGNWRGRHRKDRWVKSHGTYLAGWMQPPSTPHLPKISVHRSPEVAPETGKHFLFYKCQNPTSLHGYSSNFIVTFPIPGLRSYACPSFAAHTNVSQVNMTLKKYFVFGSQRSHPGR